MRARLIMAQAKASGVTLSVDGANLVAEGPPLVEPLRQALRANKAEIMALLHSSEGDDRHRGHRPHSDGPAETAAAPDVNGVEERAAIVEEGAGCPRGWAEWFARIEASGVPRGVAPRTWLAAINAVGHLLDRWGGKAHSLGWSPDEMLGLDPRRPETWLERGSQSYLLVIGEVVDVTAHGIVLSVRGETHYIFPRHRAERSKKLIGLGALRSA